MCNTCYFPATLLCGTLGHFSDHYSWATSLAVELAIWTYKFYISGALLSSSNSKTVIKILSSETNELEFKLKIVMGHHSLMKCICKHNKPDFKEELNSQLLTVI
jgi:hypothetical protein